MIPEAQSGLEPDGRAGEVKQFIAGAIGSGTLVWMDAGKFFLLENCQLRALIQITFSFPEKKTPFCLYFSCWYLPVICWFLQLLMFKTNKSERKIVTCSHNTRNMFPLWWSTHSIWDSLGSWTYCLWVFGIHSPIFERYRRTACVGRKRIHPGKWCESTWILCRSWTRRNKWDVGQHSYQLSWNCGNCRPVRLKFWDFKQISILRNTF